MNASDKPTPSQAWRFAQKLLADEERERAENLRAEEELARLDKMTDQELEAELAAEGRGSSWVPSAESLLAGAEKHAARRAEAGVDAGPRPAKVVAVGRPRRPTRLMWLMAAAFLLLVGGLAATQGPAIVAFFKGEKNEPIGPDNEKPAQPTPREAAEKLRDEAIVACDGEMLGTCRDKLDQAKKLDPAGESEARVQEKRALIQSRVFPDANFDGKPGRK